MSRKLKRRKTPRTLGHWYRQYMLWQDRWKALKTFVKWAKRRRPIP